MAESLPLVAGEERQAVRRANVAIRRELANLAIAIDLRRSDGQES
jgi:hypothetical protein